MFVETESERLDWLVAHELSAAQRASAATLRDYHLRWAARFALNRDEALLLTASQEETVQRTLIGGDVGRTELRSAGKIEGKRQKEEHMNLASAVALRRCFAAMAFIMMEFTVGALAAPRAPNSRAPEESAALSQDAYRI